MFDDHVIYSPPMVYNYKHLAQLEQRQAIKNSACNQYCLQSILDSTTVLYMITTATLILLAFETYQV